MNVKSNFTLHDFSITNPLTVQTEANKYSHMEILLKRLQVESIKHVISYFRKLLSSAL